jgi:hypothetical protein
MRNFGLAAVVGFGLGATTIVCAAMPVGPPVQGDPGIDRVDCAYGWYRGPDGRCYIAGTGPRYYRRGYYRDRDYYDQPDWRPDYGGYPRWHRNPENDEY